MWKVTESKPDPHLCSIIRGCLHHEEELTQSAPHMPFPQNACCFKFKIEGGDKIPLPIGLLFTLWKEQEAWHGPCGNCQNPTVYGIGCGGMLATGGVIGYCTTCDTRNFYFLGGMAAVARQLEQMIEHTPYRIGSGCYGGCFKGPKLPLYQRLQQLKWHDLPPLEWLDEDSQSEAQLREAARS
ncbi:MAG: hypothetical protein O2818_00790 [Bacteroidetes bacterium]|nr:hypothetical protein [Bacteroidota bacterium]MDA1335399.1 hypothetical protein [Bacteroidota bacterium]